MFNECTAHDLYEALINAINPILVEEQSKRETLMKQYHEDTKPAQELFNTRCAKQIDEATREVNALKSVMDERCKKILMDAQKRIALEERRFQKKQSLVQARYDNETKDEQIEFDFTTAELRAILEQELAKIGDEANERIKPFNEAYRARAAQLGLTLD